MRIHMNNVYLHGSLGKEFGRHHRFVIDEAIEAIQALIANFPHFANAIRRGHYRVVIGKTARDGMEVGEADMLGLKLGNQSLHVIPVTAGSKRGGIGKIIAGIALIGLSAVTGGAPLAGTAFLSGGSLNVGALAGTLGKGMLLTGVASLIAPEMKSGDDTKSFTMTGPQNNTREGGIVPIAYGEVVTGGTMISGSLNIVTKEV